MKKITPLLLLSSALFMASCGTTPAPDKAAPGALTALSGTLQEPTFNESTLTFGTQAWTGGAGTLIAQDAGGKEQARATLAADGNFNLTLPATVAADRLTLLDVAALNGAEGCTGTVTASAQANGTALELRVDANKDGSVAPASFRVDQDSQGNPTALAVTTGLLVYVDRAVTLKGSQTCTAQGESATLNVDWQLRQGWNKASATLTINSAGSGSINLTSGSFPDTWLYLEGDTASPLSAAGLGSQSLKASKYPLPFFR